MEQGWVYVLMNPAMPGLIKVGQTTRLCSQRAAELSGATGIATPFILVFEQPFRDCVAAEHDIHGILDRCQMRYARNREFFRGPIPEIIRLILQYATETGDYVASPLLSSGRDLLAQGDASLLGERDTFQDIREALRYYQLAAAQGSLVAFERLGAILAEANGQARGSRTRAMGYLRDGLKRGNYYCYCEIAALAVDEANVTNFVKAWDLFFAQRNTAPVEEVEAGPDRYLIALQRYVVTSFSLGMLPGHVTELTAEANALVRLLTRTLDTVRYTPGSRRSVGQSLRWAQKSLLRHAYASPDPRPAFGWLPRWTVRWRDATA